jgi:DNA-binding MarR family transcriptional regulator
VSSPATHTRPRLSSLELAAWGGFLRAHAALVKELDDELERETGLALNAYEVLLRLRTAPHGAMRMSELADSVLLSRSGMTRLVDRLVRDGLVERRVCQEDGRGLLAVLTAQGRRRFGVAHRVHLAGVRERFLGRFSEEELGELARLWERVLPEAAGSS